MEEKKQVSKKNWKHNNKNHGNGSGPVYCLGLIGALVYFIQQVDGFWPTILAILKSLVWPVFVVYELLKSFYS